MGKIKPNSLVQPVLGLFGPEANMTVSNSGHFWYPPGGYMGWHTNSFNPGWRLYITYVDEPGKSFFRYRDPSTGKIVTSMDEQWDFRMFRVDRDEPLWHAVYSETNRFSMGYIVRTRSLRFTVKWHFRRLLQALVRNPGRLGRQ